MATVSVSPSFSFCTICRADSPSTTVLPSATGTITCSFPVGRGGLRLHKSDCVYSPGFSIPNKTRFLNLKKMRSLAEEGVLPIQEGVEGEEAGGSSPAEEPPVSVTVSPSDVLTMFFQAEGTVSEASVFRVRAALEGTEGVSDLRIKTFEGIAVVELKKETTVQATGVASDLVQLLQNSGFKLQTLNLSFKDDEDTS